jgi:hypothetical protein
VVSAESILDLVSERGSDGDAVYIHTATLIDQVLGFFDRWEREECIAFLRVLFLFQREREREIDR